MSKGKPSRPAGAPGAFTESYAMPEQQSPGQPKAREVRSELMFAELQGRDKLVVFWGGEDRTRLLAGLCEQVHTFDPAVNIDGSFACRTEDYAGVLLLLRRRGPDPIKNHERLTQLGDRLREFAAQPFAGQQIPARRVDRMAVEAPDRPGWLCRVAKEIADRGLNIAKLETETADLAAGRGGAPDPRCLLLFTLELPRTDPALLEELRQGITRLDAGARVGFGAGATRMLFDLFTRSPSDAATFPGVGFDEPLLAQRLGPKTP